MEDLFGGADRGEAIDRARQQLLDQTTLSFLPYRQVRFMEDYAELPGNRLMSIRDRIKLIPDDYRRKFLRRVEIVVQHSLQAKADQVSEFAWEADAWRDIFGTIRDDERLRMDKREYNFKATVLDASNTENGENVYAGRRIPDLTIGLASYFSGDPADQGVDERERRIRRSLQKIRLIRSIWTYSGKSLIADPKWGKYTLLYPFAVYEAKRDQKSEIAVKIQLKLAFDAYLKLLDRLVRQPGTRDEYQKPSSKQFQVYGFTSSGSLWRVYVGYLPEQVKGDIDTEDDPLCDNNSHMKQIWSGNTFERQDAGELLDIVDQIHEYAVTTHRPFVASHLETWERYIETIPKETVGDTPENFPSLENEQEIEDGWHSIKSNGRRVRKSLHGKRKKNTPLTDDDVVLAGIKMRIKNFRSKKKSHTNGPARKRGRPNKVPIVTNNISENTPVRKRGRPRKVLSVESSALLNISASKRKRGRPRKIQIGNVA